MVAQPANASLWSLCYLQRILVLVQIKTSAEFQVRYPFLSTGVMTAHNCIKEFMPNHRDAYAVPKRSL